MRFILTGLLLGASSQPHSMERDLLFQQVLSGTYHSTTAEKLFYFFLLMENAVHKYLLN